MKGEKKFDGCSLDAQTVEWSVQITGPSPAETFFVALQCKNMPTDGRVGFTVTCDDPGVPQVSVPMTPIYNPNLVISVPVSGWPAGASGEVSITYEQGATPPPAGASITVSVMVPMHDAVA